MQHLIYPSPRAQDPVSWFLDRFQDNRSSGSTEEISNRRWMPPMDIREAEDTYEVLAELPGMSKEDIDIRLEDNVLTLSGDRKFDTSKSEDSYHRLERSYGAFSRSFSLPRKARPDDIKASFQDGILTLTIPKADEAKPRKIEIN